jgi:hypothetical protein
MHGIVFIAKWMCLMVLTIAPRLGGCAIIRFLLMISFAQVQVASRYESNRAKKTRQFLDPPNRTRGRASGRPVISSRRSNQKKPTVSRSYRANRDAMRSIAKLMLVLVLAAIAALFASAEAQTNKMTSMVRAVHAVYDAPAVDVYVNNVKTLSDFAYFSVSSYLSVPAANGTSSTMLRDGLGPRAMY